MPLLVHDNQLLFNVNSAPAGHSWQRNAQKMECPFLYLLALLPTITSNGYAD
jgi:hypothetical protein